LLAVITACGARSHRNEAAGDAHVDASGGGGSGSPAAGGGSTAQVAGSGGSPPASACGAAVSQAFDAAHMQPYSVSAEVSAAVASTLSKMGPAEKATQMLGLPVGSRDFTDIERSPDVQVAGVGTIRGYLYRDGVRGVNLGEGQPIRPSDGNNFSTAFPAASVRAASWDVDLEKRIGAAIGDEMAASMNNLLLGPSADVVRHPYWGRTQEAYGEDSYHIGRMATAFTVGLQQYVTGCANHFLANTVEKNRSNQDAVMNEQTVREVYGRTFEMVIQDGGVGCVMAAYNLVNGVKATQNEHLLRGILKAPVEQGGFGFQGFVISDMFALPGDQNIPDTTSAQEVTDAAVRAGLDVERAWQLNYSPETLARADQSRVEDAARRVLTQKYRFNSAIQGGSWSLQPPTSTLTAASIDANRDHEALAEQAELESAVLLTNGPADAPVLPLIDANNIAVLGIEQTFGVVSWTLPKSCPSDVSNGGQCVFHFATDPALGDRGSSAIDADPTRAIGPFAGIQAAAGGARQVTSGSTASEAADADTIVVVVGDTTADEGEEFTNHTGGDRSSLDLPPGHAELVESALDLMKPTVIVIESGSIVNLPWLGHPNQNQATIWAGYPGARGALALGKLLFGAANFSGKMPVAWPTQNQLDFTPFKERESSTTMSYFFGYRDYDRREAAGEAVDLVFPFGHGLSYSSFVYSNLTAPCQTVAKDAIVDVSVHIENTSTVDGDEIAMLFVEPPPKAAAVTGDRPIKELKSFARVSVKAGKKQTATLPLRIRDLRRWEGGANGKYIVDSGDYTILVGKNAADAVTGGVQATLTVQGD
jgi:beta-glucosidase